MRIEPLYKDENKIISVVKDKLSDFTYQIGYTYRNIRSFFRNIKKHGILLRNYRLSIKTLPASWNDSDTLILHSNFQLLTDFIEKECYSMAKFCGIGKDLQTKIEKSMAFIDSQFEDDEDTIKTLGEGQDWFKNKHKAYAEMKDLYIWWTQTRPRKLEEIDKVFSDYYDQNSAIVEYNSETIFNNLNRSLKDTEFKQLRELGFQLEKDLYEEDTKNLIRLISIREYLWT